MSIREVFGGSAGAGRVSRESEARRPRLYVFVRHRSPRKAHVRARSTHPGTQRNRLRSEVGAVDYRVVRIDAELVLRDVAAAVTLIGAAL